MKLFGGLLIFGLSVEGKFCQQASNGKKCLAWDSRRNFQPPCDDPPKYCSNPDNDPSGPWCYTGYGKRNHWSRCDSSCDTNICPPPPQSTDCNKTANGETCAIWSESVDMSSKTKTKEWMRTQRHNNCANPDDDSKGAWCFSTEITSSRRNYGYCDCTEPPSTPSYDPVEDPPTPSCGPMQPEFLHIRGLDDGKIMRPSVWTKPNMPPSWGEYSIVNGEEALAGMIPWQVQLIGPAGCGATLVSRRVVITAAHCVDSNRNPRLWAVQAGHIRRASSWATNENGQRRKVIELAVGDFNHGRRLNNDIAIMVTDKPFDYSDYLKPACLPPKNFVPAGGVCIISGWGTTSAGGRSSSKLLWTLVPMLEPKICNDKLRTRLTDNMICGGGNGPDTCQGDSGGPLVCILKNTFSGENQYLLAGITSWGYGCGDTPGVYCEVADHVDWINSFISKYG